MTTEKPAAERSSKEEATQEQSDEFVGVTRPIARRMSGILSTRAPATENTGTLPASGNTNNAASTAPEQRASAWTKYPPPATSQSPPPEPNNESVVVPPPDTDATLATQAAAQQLWENHAAAESDQTASTTPPPDSPPPAATTATASQPPTNTLQAMLTGIGTLSNGLGNLTNQQAMQLHELYLKTLKAAVSNAAHGKPPEPAAEQVKEEKEDAQVKADQTPGAGVSRPRAERAHPANGTLAILPEPIPRPVNQPFPEPVQSLPSMPARAPPPSPFHPAPTSGAPPAQLANLQPQQVVELLGEMLRAQTSAATAAPPLQQNSLTPEQPALVMNGSGIPPYANFRYNSQEVGVPQALPQGIDAEMYNKLAARRWNSCASLASDSSMYHGGFTPNNSLANNSLASLPQNLTGAESQALLQALQQKYQASELESMANITIQAILAASASRDSQGMRKRKLPDVFEEQRRHNSMLSDGENFQYVNGQQQVCTECGTTTTPTWRRSGKRLMCNACGLRRSRSMRSSRSASMSLNPPQQQSVGLLEHPIEEPAKMHAGM